MLKKNKDYIIFGKITKPHGLKGELRLLPFFADTDFFHKLKEIVLFKNDQILGSYKLKASRTHSKFILIKLENIDSIESTANLIASEVALTNEQVPAPKADEFYIEDLIGLKVITPEDKLLGEIRNVYQSPSNDVYEILTPSGDELLMPGIKAYVLKIDFATKTMIANEPKYT